MAFTPDTAGRDEEDGCGASAEQEVARQNDNVGQVEPGGLEDLDLEGDCVGGEDGAEAGREDAGPAEHKGDEIASSNGPVERIVGVVGRLGGLPDEGVSTLFPPPMCG